jgi:hypothetical protein
MQHPSNAHKLKHLLYSGGWKKFEPVWNFLIKTRSLNDILPVLETVLSKIKLNEEQKNELKKNIPVDLNSKDFNLTIT